MGLTGPIHHSSKLSHIMQVAQRHAQGQFRNSASQLHCAVSRVWCLLWLHAVVRDQAATPALATG